MQVTRVPIGKLIRDPNNPRKTSTDSRQALKASISIHDILVPLVGFEVDEGIMVADGHGRLEVALELGKLDCPVIILPRKPSEAELLVTQLAINGHRESLNPIEEYEAFVRAMKLMNWSASQLAQGLPVSGAEVTRVMSIGKLSVEERQLVLEGKISKSSAYALSRMPPEVRAVMALKAAQGEITRDELNKQARRTKKTVGAKTRRFCCPMAEGTISVQAIEGMNWDSLIELLEKLLKECKRSKTQGIDITTAERVMRDRNRVKPAA